VPKPIVSEYLEVMSHSSVALEFPSTAQWDYIYYDKADNRELNRDADFTKVYHSSQELGPNPTTLGSIINFLIE
jgi:hypothetical protein